MTARMRRRHWLPVLILGAALLVAATLRFWALSTKSLFLDEAFSLTMGGARLHDLLSAVARHDVHPPLFYLAAHAALVTLHWPPTDYRWLTAPLGLITVVATFAVVRRIADETAAALAALLVATAPALVQFDRLFRMYALVAALSTVSWWLLLVATESTGRKRVAAWVAYGIVAIALPYTHYLGLLVLFSQALYSIKQLRNAWPALAWCFAATAAILPWIAYASGTQYRLGGNVANGPAINFYWLGVARGALLGSGVPVSWLHANHAFDVVFLVLVTAVLVTGAWLARNTMLPFWLLPVAIQIVATLLTGKNLLIPRYFLHMVPAAAASLSVVVSRLLQSNARVAGAVVVACVLALNAVSVANTLLVPAYQASDWYAVDLLLSGNERSQDRIVFDQGMAYLVMQSYRSAREHEVFTVDQPDQVARAVAWADAQPNRRIWYIGNQAANVDPSGSVLEHLRATRKPLAAWLQPHVEPESEVYVALFGPRLARGPHPVRP